MGRIIRANREGSSLIKRDRFQAQMSAKAIVKEAQKRAEDIHIEAENRAKGLREQATAQGREEGLLQIAELMVQASKLRNQAFTSMEKEIVDLAIIAAEAIIGKELSMHPERIKDTVAPIIKKAQRSRNICVQVNPQDIPALENALPQLAANTNLTCAIKLEPQTSITKGGCIVTTELGTFDARIEVQLNALTKLLQKEGVFRL